ncbi:MAG: TldD/PmbA family protein [Actinomycetota bacterium]|nr:TldD/PmbA family protein [Actinomycetota bacterium]
MGETNSKLEELAAIALSETRRRGAEYADVFIQEMLITQVRLEDGRVSDLSLGQESGLGVRAIRGMFASYAHTDVLKKEHVEEVARQAAAALQHAEAEGGVILPGGKQTLLNATKLPQGHGELGQIADMLKSCDEATRSLSKEIMQVSAAHTGATQHTLVMSSKGDRIYSSCERTRLVVQVVASRGGVAQTGVEAPGKLMGLSFYENIRPVEVALVAARRALTMLDAKPSPTGKMPVVLSAGTGGVLIHEACGHGLEADHVQKGASVYAGKIGEKVAGELVSICDNPSLPDLWGSYEYDDEGTPARENILIDGGILEGFLYANHEAMRDSAESTGNGRRESFRYLPIPRMSNTFLAPGRENSGDIISGTSRGLYAKKLGGGQVDPLTGDYVFAVSEGYLIEKGRITSPVRGATLIGNGPRTLQMIDAVGNDLEFEEGTCGKEGQGVPVTTGCPTFRIEGLTVGGTEA